MLAFPRAGRRRPAAILLATATMAAFTTTVGSAAQAGPPAPTALYIIQTADAPVATYTGGVSGIAATRPAAGKKIDTRAANVRRYRSHLDARRAEVLRRANIGSDRVAYDYTLVFAGFTARLTATEAERLRHTAGVAQVWKNRTVTAQTFTTPRFVGLDGPDGAWRKQFGSPERAGEGIIVGVIDSGFWPENPSFAALPTPRPDQPVIDAKWHGTCVPGDEAPVTCSNKVIGARWYHAGRLDVVNPGEFSSPRDYFGHGSHTASTAAGDHGVTATINGTVAGQVSGMAPAARLAVYKVLYANAAGTQSVGSTADIVAAINDAVADGVDVINYSIGEDVDDFGPVELTFLNAASAGVFVAASAGNAGPGAGTVDNGMPWTTTAAAGTHDRAATKTVALGNGQRYTGAGVGAGVGPAPLVDAAVSGAAGSDPTLTAQCVSNPPQLDPAKVTGKIVLCVRGNNDRVDKSLGARNAGGVGMILYNPTPNSLNADYHSVPTIHVDDVAGPAIKAYAATAGATATISAQTTETAEAPQVATFSSRGPGPSSNGDLLKPDIMAPGVDVVAASAPPSHNGNLWNADSGTSMASPHIAGIAALIIAKHPAWSPMAVKSALMTTAQVLDNRGKPIADQADGANATPLEMGAGEVAARPAFDPGLVYDSGLTQWLQYSCGIGVHLATSGGADVCDAVGTVDPSNYNSPALAVGDLAGKQTLTRTVTNVTRLAGVYLPTVNAPRGFTVNVSPKVLVVPPGTSRSYTVSFTRTDAAFGEWSFGSLRWRDPLGHDVRSAIALRAVALAAPAEVEGVGASGSVAIPVTAGFAGTLTAVGNGLVAATVTPLALTPGNTFDPAAPATSANTGSVTVTVPDGTKAARFATYAADYPAGTDVDLFVYEQGAGGALTLVGQSAGGTAEESVTLTEPGTYVAFANLFATPDNNPATVRIHSYVVAPANAGNLTVTPASQPVTVGGAATVTAAWSGLAAGQRYLGVVDFGDGTQQVGSTLISVNAG
ncbi:MAG TPA: S8 family serine peptidase [Asanoa sp.]